MSGGDDYPYEMREPRPLSDRSVEDLFAGKLVPGEEDLAAFAHSVRAWAQGPVPTPGGELARMLADGLTTDKGDLPATAASKATGPRAEASGLPKWRRPLVATSSFLTAMFTKVGMASAAAKGGLAAAVAAGAVTAGAAAGALPAPVQNAVSHAVGAVLPVQLPTDGTTVQTPARPSGSTPTVPAPGGQTTSHPSGPPANPGSQSSTGLDTANSTPAAGHAPVSVPTPANPGSQATNHPSGPPAGTSSQSTAGSGATTGSGSAPTVDIPVSIPVSGSAPTGGISVGSTAGSSTAGSSTAATGGAPVAHPGR